MSESKVWKCRMEPDGRMQISHRSEDGYSSGGVIDRPELFALAPEMARLLLAQEWGDVNVDNTSTICPWCESYEPEVHPTRRAALPSRGHKPDCAWLLTLRRAGVLE